MNDTYWAKPVTPRHDLWLIAPSLDELVPPDAKIRAFEAVLKKMDWKPWEARYARVNGQPPLHPMLIAGTILYCTMNRALSSRQQENATRNWVDLSWFLEGRTIDHSTLCGFRKQFRAELEGLFAQACKTAAVTVEAPESRTTATDGTRIRANSDRHGARTAASLKRRLEEVAERRAALLDQMDRADAAEEAEALAEQIEAGEAADRAGLEAQLARLDAQRAQLARALEVAQARDAAKQAHEGPGATPTRVPVTDPDATLLPNKEGGFAPNYTPLLTVDVASGAILDARVVEGSQEAEAMPASVAAAQQRVDEPITAALADGSFPTGPNLEHFEQAGQPALYSPAPATVQPLVVRDDPRQPVAAEHWDKLAMSGKDDKARLARETFLYVAAEDTYYCPQGRALQLASQERRKLKGGQTVTRWRYQCADCSGCPLAARCLNGAAKARGVMRDESQPQRDRLAARMSTDEAKTLYAQRAPVVEGVIGVIKHAMGVRRFLTRGRASVANEWLWICAAYNLRKILRWGRAGQSSAAKTEHLCPAQGGPRPGSAASGAGSLKNALKNTARAFSAMETAWTVCSKLIHVFSRRRFAAAT
jgi:transposase